MVIAFIYFSILMTDDDISRASTLIIACFCATLLFMSGLLFDYVIMGATTDKITNKQLRNFLWHFQTGRKISIKASEERIEITVGTESEEIELENLTYIETKKDMILLEKENIAKAYIPKRACTDEQWNELVAMFTERKSQNA